MHKERGKSGKESEGLQTKRWRECRISNRAYNEKILECSDSSKEKGHRKLNKMKWACEVRYE